MTTAKVIQLPVRGAVVPKVFVPEDLKHKVAFIPGLRLDPEGECWGSLDAIDAAAQAIGRPFDVASNPKHDWRTTPGLKEELEKNLYPFQVDGVQMIVGRLRNYGGAMLADSMGLGKTRTALGVIKVLCPSQTLIVVPASVRGQWVSEAALLGLKAIAVTKGKDAALAIDAPIVVTSYALVEKVLEVLGVYPSFICFDEGHRLMGRKSKAVLALTEACDAANWKLTLTGTPIWSETRDYYAQLRLVLGRRFGKAFDFDVRYCNGHFGEHGFVNKGSSQPEELKRRLSFYTIRRTKAEVAQQLPPLTRSVRWVDGDTHSKRKLSLMMASSSKRAVIDALIATLDAKVDMAVDACVEARQFLCFSYTRKHVAMIAEGVRKAGLECVVLTGADTPEQRKRKVLEAERRRIGVVATFGAASTGVDGLQKVATTGIMHSMLWVPAEMMQAEDRLHRFGASLQTPVQWVYLCMKDSADEFVQTKLVRRLDVWQRVMHAKGDGTKELRDSLDDSLGVDSLEDQRVLRMLMSKPSTADDIADYDLELGGDE